MRAADELMSFTGMGKTLRENVSKRRHSKPAEADCSVPYAQSQVKSPEQHVGKYDSRQVDRGPDVGIGNLFFA